jgi:hypothetical protein
MRCRCVGAGGRRRGGVGSKRLTSIASGWAKVLVMHCHEGRVAAIEPTDGEASLKGKAGTGVGQKGVAS